MTEEIKIRELNVDDVFTVAAMLGKITKPARFQIIAYIKKGDKPHTQVENVELVLTILQSLLVDANDDIKGWMADIAQIDKETFRKMPAGTVITIGKQIAKLEGIQDFLAGVSQLLPEEKK
jgi:hypothetical protein